MRSAWRRNGASRVARLAGSLAKLEGGWMETRTVLGVYLGAVSGRVMAVQFDGQCLSYEEIHRLQNVPVTVSGTLHWDILRLWGDVQSGIRKASDPAAIGMDTWGVDFAFLDKAG